MKRLLVCLLLVGVVGCGTSPTSEPPLAQNESPEPPPVETDAEKAKREYEKGIGFAERGDGGFAIACFSAAILLKQLDHPAAYFHRGLVYADQGQHDKAIADYTDSIELDSNEGEVYYNRATSYKELGDKDKAAADLAKAKELDYEPDDE